MDTRALPRRITPGGYKHDDIVTFVDALRKRQVTCMPPSTRRGGRAPLTVGPGGTRALSISEQTRKRVEEICGWLKTVGLFHQVKLRGVPRVGWRFTFAAAAYNLIRIRNLVTVAT